MNLLLIRHGSTAWTQPPRRFQGRTDVPLAPEGYRKRMNWLLASARSGWMLCGPVRCSGLIRRPVGWSGVTEARRSALTLDLSNTYGRWERRTNEEVAMTDGNALAAWESGACAEPPGGESRAELLERVGAFLDERVGGGTVAVVAHKEVLRTCAIHLGLLDSRLYPTLEVLPGGVLPLTGRPGSWSFLPLAEGLRSVCHRGFLGCLQFAARKEG